MTRRGQITRNQKNYKPASNQIKKTTKHNYRFYWIKWQKLRCKEKLREKMKKLGKWERKWERKKLREYAKKWENEKKKSNSWWSDISPHYVFQDSARPDSFYLILTQPLSAPKHKSTCCQFFCLMSTRLS